MGLGFFERPMDRRQFLVRGAVGAGGLALAACGGDSVSGAARSSGQLGGNVSLSFSSWNTTGSLRSFRSFADRYHAAHPGVDVLRALSSGPQP